MSINSEELEKKLVGYKKKVWFPIVDTIVDTKRSSNMLSSKFSGIAYIPSDEEWPKCENCDRPMQLFLQLNSADLPLEMDAETSFGKGFLQVFYCTNDEEMCEIECESFFPFSKATSVRVVTLIEREAKDYKISPVSNAFPEKIISGWRAEDDYPGWEELEALGLDLSEEESDLLDDLGFPKGEDKLSGWPDWIQGVEYPDCPKCREKMDLIFQIDSDDNIPYMFGDVGCSYVVQCKTHPEILTIIWACS